MLRNRDWWADYVAVTLCPHLSVQQKQGPQYPPLPDYRRQCLAYADALHQVQSELLHCWVR
jgi:hypothetical protein